MQHSNVRRGTLAVAAAVAALSFGGVTRAANVYWDSNGSTGGAGAAPAGTWGTDAFWSADPNGAAATGAYVAGSDVFFSAGNDATGAFTLNVNGAQTANSVEVQEGNITLAGSQINTGSNAFTIRTGARVVIPSSLAFNSAGKVVLAGGTLANANPAATASSFINAAKGLEINGSGTVEYTAAPGASATTIYTGTITGTGGLTNNGGAGTLIKTGVNEFRVQGTALPNYTFAKLVVNEGLYRIGGTSTAVATADLGFGAAPLTELADAITLNGGQIGASLNFTTHLNRGVTIGPLGGTFNGGGPGTITFQGPVSGSGTMTISGGGGLILSHANNVNSFTGNLVVTAGTLTLNSPLKTPNFSGTGGAVSVATGQTFTVDGSANTSYAGVVSGAGTFLKKGTGVFTLNPPAASAEWSVNNVVVDAGTIRFGTSAAGFLNSGALTVNAGATFDMNSINDTTGTLSGSGSVINNNGSTGLTLQGSSSAAFSGTFTGTSRVRINKPTGTQTLSGDNSGFAGGVTIRQGVLAAGHANALGASPLLIDPSSTTVLPKLTTTAPLTIANNVNINRVTLTGTPTFTLQVGGTSDMTLSGVIANSVPADAGALQKVDANTVTLSGANTYTGGTTVNAGTLVAANADAVGGGDLAVNDGATVRAQLGLPKAVTVNALTFPGTGTGKLDLVDNDLVIKSGTLAGVTAQIVAGYNNGTWDGAGIAGSAAATDENADTALGFVDNAELGLTSFSNVTLTGPEILVKYTYYGDADLTGVVDTDDFQLFLAGYQDGTLPRTWLYGDFDYNSVIDTDDFQVFLYGYQNQGGALSALSEVVASADGISSSDRAFMQAAIAAVPEPASLGVLGLASAALLGRRSRRRA